MTSWLVAHEGSVEGLKEGDRYRVEAATGDELAGRVVVNDPPYEFAGTVEGLNDALACLRMHDVGGPSPDSGHVACLWLSSWGVPKQEVEALGERWKRLLDGLSASEG